MVVSCLYPMLGVNVSCEADKLYAQGTVLAISDQQRAQITEQLKNNKKFSCPAAPERQVHGGTGHTHTHSQCTHCTHGC